MYTIITNTDRQEWLDSRKKSIGATDAGTILGINSHCSIAELWAVKMGMLPDDFKMNESAFWGLEMEDKLASMYSQAVLTESGNLNVEATMQNEQRTPLIDTGNDLYVSNESSFFSCTPDRLCKVHPKYEGMGCVELKTISKEEAYRWVGNIPPRYIVQIQWQMFVTECAWADLAVLEGGNSFRVLHFERDDIMIEQIKKAAYGFIDKWQKGIEPGVESTPAYEKYLSRRFTDDETIIGEDDAYKNNTLRDSYDDALIFAEQYKKVTNEEKKVKRQKLAISNGLKHCLKNNACFLYENGTKITWKVTTRGGRILKVKIPN